MVCSQSLQSGKDGDPHDVESDLCLNACRRYEKLLLSLAAKQGMQISAHGGIDYRNFMWSCPQTRFARLP